MYVSVKLIKIKPFIVAISCSSIPTWERAKLHNSDYGRQGLQLRDTETSSFGDQERILTNYEQIQISVSRAKACLPQGEELALQLKTSMLQTLACEHMQRVDCIDDAVMESLRNCVPWKCYQLCKNAHNWPMCDTECVEQKYLKDVIVASVRHHPNSDKQIEQPALRMENLESRDKRYRLGLYDCIASYCTGLEGNQRKYCIVYFCHAKNTTTASAGGS